MIAQIAELFNDQEMIKKIQNKLPALFRIADLESSRNNQIGMEVGSVREKILIALLMYKFGEDNVTTEKITQPEIDVVLFNQPISIKTGTGKRVGGTKLIWTVDAQNAREFSVKYTPSCDMIYVHINWANKGGLYYIPKETQLETMGKMGKSEYIKLPKEGTNPRGVEMSANAMRENVGHKDTLSININWIKENIDFKPYKRWVELWQEN